MNYLVTGGAGFIGAHIAGYLFDRGHDLTVIDNLFSGKKESIQHLRDNPHFHFLQGSITDPGLLKDVFRGADGIFPQAATTPVMWSNHVTTSTMKLKGSSWSLDEPLTMHGRTGREILLSLSPHTIVLIFKHMEPVNEGEKSNEIQKMNEIKKKYQGSSGGFLPHQPSYFPTATSEIAVISTTAPAP